jgi:hypothetical protein
MGTRLLEEWIGHTQDKAGFGWEFIDEKGVILVMDGKVRTKIVRKRYLRMEYVSHRFNRWTTDNAQDVTDP